MSKYFDFTLKNSKFHTKTGAVKGDGPVALASREMPSFKGFGGGVGKAG